MPGNFPKFDKLVAGSEPGNLCLSFKKDLSNPTAECRPGIIEQCFCFHAGYRDLALFLPPPPLLLFISATPPCSAPSSAGWALAPGPAAGRRTRGTRPPSCRGTKLVSSRWWKKLNVAQTAFFKNSRKTCISFRWFIYSLICAVIEMEVTFYCTSTKGLPTRILTGGGGEIVGWKINTKNTFHFFRK